MKQDYTSLKASLSGAIQADGGLAVFRYYGFEPSRKAQKINPFRQERTSSFYITQKNGHCFFKDFGDDTLKGDCWKFVQLYENTDYNGTFQILCRLYGIFAFEVTTSSKAQVQPTKEKIIQPIFEKKLVEIQFRPFSQEELDFWQQKGGINQAVLAANGVRSVQSFKIQTSETKIRQFNLLKFVFAYEIIPQQSYKLYMPKSEHRVYAQAKTVFLPNLHAARQTFGENYAYTFGMRTLHNEPFILCAGEPDCLALKAMGYNALTLGDERSSIPDFVWDTLKSRFQTQEPQKLLQAVLYDTDHTGVKSARKLGNTYQVPALLLPKLQKQLHPTQAKPLQNDVCDYLGLYGADSDFHLTLQQQIFENKDYRLSHIPVFPVKKYLSEKADFLTRFIQKNKRIQIDADAGVGKTYTMLVEIPKQLQKPVLFAVPFAIQVEQIEQEYQQRVDNLVCFTNQSTQSLTEDDWAYLQGRPVGKVNVCTIDRLAVVYDRLVLEYGNEIVIIIDESHLLTSEYAYRTRAIQETLQVCRKATKTIYLSATPDYALCRFFGFKLIRFKRKINPKIEIQAIDYVGSAKKALLKCLTIPLTPEGGTSLTPDPSPKERGEVPPSEVRGFITIVRLNNKTLAKVIANLLIAQGIYQPEEIDFVFSEKRHGVSTPTKDSIVNHALIPEKVRLLFVTACFDCGINILNTNIERIIHFETQHTDNCLDTFKQLIARFRKLDKVQITVCKPARYLELPDLKPKAQLYERLTRDAKNKLDLLPFNELPYQRSIQQQIQDAYTFGFQSPKTPKYIKINHDISAVHKLIHWDKKTDIYTINYNYIRFMLKEYERKGMNSNHFYTYLQQELPNCSLSGRFLLEADKDTANQVDLQVLLNQEKEIKKNHIALVCKVMRQNTQPFFDAVHAAYRDTALKAKIKQHFAVSSLKEAPKLESMFSPLSAEGGTFPLSFGESAGVRLVSPSALNGLPSDEVITTLSHRYFQLIELHLPKERIPDLLEENAGDTAFSALMKALTNHIYLFVRQRAGDKFADLVQDRRKLEDVHWLELLTDAARQWKPKTYSQKRSTELQERNALLLNEIKQIDENATQLQLEIKFLKQRIDTGEHLRSELRELQRRESALLNKIVKKKEQLSIINEKLQESLVMGFEINTLSDKINRLRPHATDWQGARTNLRLLGSLYEIHTQKRAVLLKNEQGEEIYTERTIVEIGYRLSFSEVLGKLGLSPTEASEYLAGLQYQIDLDMRNISAKSSQKSLESSIEYIFNTAMSDKCPF